MLLDDIKKNGSDNNHNLACEIKSTKPNRTVSLSTNTHRYLPSQTPDNDQNQICQFLVAQRQSEPAVTAEVQNQATSLATLTHSAAGCVHFYCRQSRKCLRLNCPCSNQAEPHAPLDSERTHLWSLSFMQTLLIDIIHTCVINNTCIILQ